jgi:hypothetical protein
VTRHISASLSNFLADAAALTPAAPAPTMTILRAKVDPILGMMLHRVTKQVNNSFDDC